ncbi:MAG TPA: hypothetical protein VF146_10740 [Bryobacteraceae bacterium]
MSSSTPGNKPPLGDQPKGYQPTLGRKLFMLGLCIVGLILVWAYYFHLQKP